MINLHGNTDIGRQRKVNQDTFSALRLSPESALCVVCDGMGGAVGGAEASRIACDTFCTVMRDSLEEIFTGESAVCSDSAAMEERLARACARVPDAMRSAALAANREVYTKAVNEPSLHGMGTTLVALYIRGDYACAINVGDSRLYAVTEAGAQQLSHDHSYVQYLVDLGKLTAEEARSSTNRNIITRAVGTAPELEIDIIPIDAGLLGRAVFLLCSDGLTNMVRDEEIASIVTRYPSPADAAERLITRANAAGGTDNITVLLLRV